MLRSALFLAGAVLSGCSDPAAPAAGTFRAQLRGVRLGTLSGFSNADRIFAEPFPGPQFAIRMYAVRGDTTIVLGLSCPGDQAPSAGKYQLDESGEHCVATYARIRSSAESGDAVLERMSASSGTLTIGPSDPGQTEGSFGFSGTLVSGADSVGSLHATGVFSADLL